MLVIERKRIPYQRIYVCGAKKLKYNYPYEDAHHMLFDVYMHSMSEVMKLSIRSVPQYEVLKIGQLLTISNLCSLWKCCKSEQNT